MSITKNLTYKGTAGMNEFASLFMKSFKEKRRFMLVAADNYSLYRREFRSCIGTEDSSINRIVTFYKRAKAGIKAESLFSRAGARAEMSLEEREAVASNLFSLSRELEKKKMDWLAGKVWEVACQKKEGARYWTQVRVLDENAMGRSPVKLPDISPAF